MSINFCTIASGSGGNSAFLSTEHSKILIDAGLSGKAIEQALVSHGIKPKDLTAIFITHEHSDHIQGAGILSRRYDLPVYMTRGSWAYAQRQASLGKIPEKNRLIVTSGTSVSLGDMEIKPFAIPHDANEPVGYTIHAEGRKITVATDLGHITKNVEENFCDSDIILLESNHDIDMLIGGPYPAYLKRRILSDTGHLSNVACGTFLADIYTTNIKHIFLAHLSGDNNHPVVAYETVRNILSARKIDVGGAVDLHLADRFRPSAMVTLKSES